MRQVSRILRVGAAHWDSVGRTDRQLTVGDDVAGRVERRPGGVALNVALGLAHHGLPVGRVFAAVCAAVLSEKPDATFTQLGRVGRGVGSLAHSGHLGEFYSPGNPGRFNLADARRIIETWRID